MTVFKSEQWLDDNFTFIKNHLDNNASLEGVMFETYGKEFEFIRGQNPECIWTYMDDDNGNPCICSGFHIINRIGYLISEQMFKSEIHVQIT